MVSDTCSKQTGSDLGTFSQISPQVPKESAHCQKNAQTFLQRVTSWRVRMILFMHLIIVLSVMFRMNMPIALTCMIKKTPSNASASAQTRMSEKYAYAIPGDLPSRVPATAQHLSINTNGGEFEWDSFTQGLILSSGGMLGFVMPMMTHHLSHRFDNKRLLLISMLVSAVFTFLQPMGARISPYLLIAFRMSIGLITGMRMALLNELLSWWAPNSEKVTMRSVVFGGLHTGNVLVGVTSAYLCTIPVDNGWPFIFYIQGSIGIIWCMLWQFMGSVRPEDHPFISAQERNYIISTRLGMKWKQKHSKPPYYSMLTSGPVWGFLIVGTVHMYGNTIVSSYLPFYLTTVFGFSVEEVGILVSVSSVVRFLGVIIWGQITKFLYAKTNINKTPCHKLIQCSGLYLCSAGLIVLGFVEEKVLALCILVIVLLSQSASLVSRNMLPLDMAPRYVGVLRALFTTISTILCIPGPIITSLMTSNGTLEEWRNVFISVAAILCAGSTCFLILGSAKLQPWAKASQCRAGPGKDVNGVSDFTEPTVLDDSPFLGQE